MAGRANNNQAEALCPTCGKRIAVKGRSGSLTSYLFGAFDCSCARAGALAQTQAKPGSTAGRGDDDSDFCPKCGLRIASNSRDGSLTGFLFQATRCKCTPDQAFADGKMGDRFSKMKEAGSGTTFVSASGATDNSGRSDALTIDLAPGATIGGAYKIVELIGRGGMGEVYLARHETLGKKCAVKVIPPEQVTEIGWQRFQLEAKAVAKLEHINLVRVTDLGIHEGCLPFYAMDYVQGKNLADLLAESGPMPLPVVLDIFIQVCEGVDCAHRSGLLHRDLKPANIMVLPQKDGRKLAKVLDFGLAKLTSHDRSRQSLTAVGDVFGSPFYMSPEQCNGQKLDRRSDIYSIGCTMFECLTGQPPFTGHLAAAVIFSHLEADPPSLESVAGKGRLPASIEIVMAKLLRKNPVERYQTLLELRGDLDRVARGEDVEPFYVSRGRHLASDVAVTPTANKQYRADASNSLFSRRRPVVLTLLLIAMALGTIGFLERRNWSDSFNRLSHPRDASASPKQQYPSVVAVQPPPTRAKETTPFSSIITDKSRQRYILFHFPPQEKIGNVVIDNDRARPKPCMGDVEIPCGHKLKLYVAPLCFAKTEYLDRIRPDDFDTLVFASLEIAEAPLTDAVLSHITHLKGLKGLSLDTCLSLDDGALAYIEQLPNLQNLVLEATSITPAGLARLPLLPRLKRLLIQSDTSVTPLLQALKGSLTIEGLGIHDSQLKHSDYQLMATLKNLNALGAAGCLSTNEDLAAISTLEKLEAIDMSGSQLDYNVLPILKKMHAHGLKSIRLSSSRMTEAEIIRLPKAGTGLVFCN